MSGCAKLDREPQSSTGSLNHPANTCSQLSNLLQVQQLTKGAFQRRNDIGALCRICCVMCTGRAIWATTAWTSPDHGVRRHVTSQIMVFGLLHSDLIGWLLKTPVYAQMSDIV